MEERSQPRVGKDGKRQGRREDTSSPAMRIFFQGGMR